MAKRKRAKGKKLSEMSRSEVIDDMEKRLQEKMQRKEGIRSMTPEEAEEVMFAKRNFGRKWRAGLKSLRREKYRRKRGGTTVLEALDGSANELIKTSVLALGSVQKRYVTCGKKDCSCMKGGARHGPYFYLSLPLPKEMVEAGLPRMKHFYITRDEAWELSQRIRNFRKLQDEAWDALWDEFASAERMGLDGGDD